MTPIRYALTEEEAHVAASRAAWRASLEGGLLARHLGPLAAFMLAVAFAAILGWTGLISRRAAELTLIAAAALYMVYRLWTRRRFLAARRAALDWGRTRREEASLALDETGFRLAAPEGETSWAFADGLEIEEVAGLVYVWPRSGRPLVWPLRAAAEGERWLVFARGRARLARPPGADDDD